MALPTLPLSMSANTETASQPIIIVSGLPRSGTSMMMKMLEAGGIEILTDNQRTADDDNPKGYYEFERVKKMKDGDLGWISEARGKAVKVISALLEFLPTQHTYKVIFMRRALNEVLASQRQMLIRRGEPTDRVSDEKMADLFQKHLERVENWLGSQPNLDVLYVSYNELLQNNLNGVEQVTQFLGGSLDSQKMAQVVDLSLYRQKQVK